MTVISAIFLLHESRLSVCEGACGSICNNLSSLHITHDSSGHHNCATFKSYILPSRKYIKFPIDSRQHAHLIELPSCTARRSAAPPQTPSTRDEPTHKILPAPPPSPTTSPGAPPPEPLEVLESLSPNDPGLPKLRGPASHLQRIYC